MGENENIIRFEATEKEFLEEYNRDPEAFSKRQYEEINKLFDSIFPAGYREQIKLESMAQKLYMINPCKIDLINTITSHIKTLLDSSGDNEGFGYEISFHPQAFSRGSETARLDINAVFSNIYFSDKVRNSLNWLMSRNCINSIHVSNDPEKICLSFSVDDFYFKIPFSAEQTSDR